MLTKHDKNLNDLIIKIKNKFSEEDIILYNAYGRLYHNKKTTELKKFIEKTIGVPFKFNILFDISKYILNFSDKQKKLYFDKFILIYNNNVNNDNIILYWMNITKTEQLDHLIKIYYNKFDNDYKIFKFINLVIDNNEEYIKIFNLRLIDYYKDIIINNKYSISLNYYKDYTSNDIIKLFSNIFEQSSTLDQTEIYTKLFQDDFSYEKTYLIISSIYSEVYKKENYIDIFNYYIRNLDNSSISTNNISNFYLKILLIINKIPIYIKYFTDCNNYYMSYQLTLNAYILSINKKYDYIYLEEYNILSLSEKFNNFLSYLNMLNEDNDYILLNKVQLINVLTYNCSNISETNKKKVSFYIHSEAFFINGDNIVIINRLRHNDMYLSIVSKIWNKIYSNIQIQYNGYIGDFIPLDLTELLYT